MLPTNRPLRALPRPLFALAGAAVGLGWSACTVVGEGDVEVNWTIEGETTESLCGDYGASEISLEFYDSSDYLYTTVAADCTAFSVTVEDLSEDDYTVKAVFLDSDGNSVSDELQKSLSIEADEEKSLTFAFDASDFDLSPEGALTVSWTIEGETAETLCSSFNATQTWVQLYDDGGDAYDDSQYVDCEDGSITLEDLPIGNYTVKVRLADVDSAWVTNALESSTLTIATDTTKKYAFDFTTDDFIE